MLTNEDLNKITGLSEEQISSIIQVSENKFAVKSGEIEKATYGKALGEVDNVLKELGFEKRGKTTDSVKNAISTLKADTENLTQLKEEIETLKKGGSTSIKEIERKNKELMQLNLDMKKKHAEELQGIETKYQTARKKTALKGFIPKENLSHLPAPLQAIVIEKTANAMFDKFDIELGENGIPIFKDKGTGLQITDEKNGYKIKEVDDILNEINIYAKSAKKVTQENAPIQTGGKSTVIPTFESLDEVTKYVDNQGFTGDERMEKYTELAKPFL